VAARSRASRRQEEELEKATLLQQKKLRKQRAIGVAVVTLLALFGAGLAFYAYRARRELEYRQLVDRGNYDLQAGNYPGGLAQFRQAAQIKPQRADAWFGIGDALVREAYGAGDARNTPILTEAIQAYQRAVAIEKDRNTRAGEHFQAQSRLAQAYVGLGDVYALGSDPDFIKAAALYKEAATTDPGSPDAFVGYGNIALEQGRLGAAIEQYQAALKSAEERNAPDYGAHTGLGSSYFLAGSYALAADEFNRAIGASPAAVIVRFRLANALYMLDHGDTRALALFASLLNSKMPRLSSLARTSLAYALLEKQEQPSPVELEQAVKGLEVAYTQDPYAFSAFRLGIARALQGRSDECSKLLDTAARLSWGSDSLARHVYTPFLNAIRGEPDGFERLGEVTGQLVDEGAAGFLESVLRDAHLLERSGFEKDRIERVVHLLTDDLAKARRHNPVHDASPPGM
jgi:tetratricopeptide (TPR) repeat protein